MTKTKRSKYESYLAIWILVAMVLGIIAGLVFKQDAHMFAPLGDIFMKLIKMMVIPLVTVSIISGAASIGNSKKAGKIGIATFAFYMGTTMFAVVIGLVLGGITKPGLGVDLNSLQSMFSNEYADKGGLPGFWETIKGFIPENPIEALGSGNILQILVFSLFLGFGISTLDSEKKTFLLKIFNYLTEAFIWMIMKVMLIAPIGVFGLMADAVGTSGFDILLKVAQLFLVYVVALLIHNYGVYGAIIGLFTKVPIKKFYSKISKAELVALSTASSMGTLPVTMEVCEDELDVSKETTSFVLPLGATINMDGNAIYYALVAMFFAQMFGIHLGMAHYIAIIFTATIGSIGQAGVPGPSLLVVAVLLAANIPIVGLPILFAVDRLFDMLRTAVNITGDATCAVVVNQIREENS